MYAAANGDMECARLLLDAGADTSPKSKVRLLRLSWVCFVFRDLFLQDSVSDQLRFCF
jgi:hypothetical protein